MTARAEGEAVGAVEHDERDLVGCEGCGARVFIGDAVTCGDDGYHCAACDAEWRAHFAACTHAWDETHDEFGDPAHICRRCSGLVLDESFPALFGHPAPARTQDPAR